MQFPAISRSRPAVAAAAMAAILAVSLVSTAAGGTGAAKVRFFLDPVYTCADGAQPGPGAESFGFAMLNGTASKGKLVVTVSLKGAAPDTDFDLWVNQDPGACPLAAPTRVAALHTNEEGNGTAQVKVKLVAGAKHFWVSAVSQVQVLRTPAATLSLKKPKR
jgi:hypothetical protein